MKQLKKTLLTLALLITAVTGAWATDYTTLAVGDVIKVGDTFTPTAECAFNDNGVHSGETYTLMRADVDDGYNVTEKTDGAYYVFKYDTFTYPYIHFEKAFAVTAISDGLEVTNIETIKGTLFYTLALHESASASAFDVTWTAATKTGTFTMPGGNVTLEPDYYPQATAAEGAVTAATDVKATTDAPLVTIDETKLTGAKKLMYYVSTDATAPAYDAQGWTDQLPTAENYTEAANLYVWYYPVGTDEDDDEATATYSDGDICSTALTVTLGAAPTYAVTLNAEGLSTDEAAAWKVAKGTDQPAAFPLEGVTKGTAVTVTYTGSKKVIGVKAEKKAAVTYPLLSAVTTEDYGKVVCADGHLHDAKTAVPDGCTAVGIIGKVTETGHGLILALKDATSQNWNTINGWTSASYAGTTLKVMPDDDARGINLTSYTTLGSTTVSNWAVAQKSDYEAIFENLGSTTGDTDGTTYDGNVNAYITTGVGGTAISGTYCSASVNSDGNVCYFHSSYWNFGSKTTSLNVRPVLGF